MHYDIQNINSQRIKYQDPKDIKFLDLSEYLELAEKNIKYYGVQNNKYDLISKMLKSEDAISKVAHDIMMADWRWSPDRPGKHRNKSSYRMYCAQLSIKSYFTSAYKLKNKKNKSLDFAMKDNFRLYDTVASGELEPLENLIIQEENELNEIMIDKSKLTDSQKLCIKYRVEGKTFKEIGKIQNKTRQNAHQMYNRIVERLKKNAD